MANGRKKNNFVSFRIFYEYMIRMDASASETGKPEMYWFSREENLKAETLRAAKKEFLKAKKRITVTRLVRNFQLLRTEVVRL